MSFEAMPVPFYVKSVRRGAANVQNGIAVPGKSSESVTVIISGNGGYVSGMVANVTMKDAATVVLVPRNGPGRPNLYRVTKADAHGFFDMRGIAPGDYEVYAWPPEEIARRDYFDPSFVKMFQGRGTAVQVGSYGDIRVQLDLLRP
jgi:hypothetical protein